MAACFATRASSSLFAASPVSHLDLRGLQIALELRYLVRRTTGARVAQIGLRGKQIGARLRELRANVGGIERQDHLPAMHRLALCGHHFLDESGKFAHAPRGEIGSTLPLLVIVAFKSSRVTWTTVTPAAAVAKPK